MHKKPLLPLLFLSIFIILGLMMAVYKAYAGGVLFQAFTANPTRLVTNEYAYWNPSAPDAIKSPDWEMTSTPCS
jgi:hypothetical protein